MSFYIYRPNRGSLLDAMQEVRIFITLDGIKEYLIEDFSKYGVTFTKDDIVFGEKGYRDVRTGWKETRSVCVAHMEGYDTPQCVGMYCSSEHLSDDRFVKQVEDVLQTNASHTPQVNISHTPLKKEFRWDGVTNIFNSVTIF